MYAMATRQADILSEYLCLYRILEAADRENGKTFAASALPDLGDRDFGVLRIVGFGDKYETATNAFSVYMDRAVRSLRICMAKVSSTFRPISLRFATHSPMARGMCSRVGTAKGFRLPRERCRLSSSSLGWPWSRRPLRSPDGGQRKSCSVEGDARTGIPLLRGS